jgi:hypothetical protein
MHFGYLVKPAARIWIIARRPEISNLVWVRYGPVLNWPQSAAGFCVLNARSISVILRGEFDANGLSQHKKHSKMSGARVGKLGPLSRFGNGNITMRAPLFSFMLAIAASASARAFEKPTTDPILAEATNLNSGAPGMVLVYRAPVMTWPSGCHPNPNAALPQSLSLAIADGEESARHCQRAARRLIKASVGHIRYKRWRSVA